MSTAVRVDDVVKTFGAGDAKTFALKGASLEARLGEMLMIVGPSGCGKTTLLSVLCGTLSANSGRIEVFGADLGNMSTGQVTDFRRSGVGFIFQQFNLIPTLTAVENVSIPLLLNRNSTREAQLAAAEVLDQVGLGKRLNAYPNQLSGGQQQRVAISRALVHNPRLIICDEPTAALDAVTGRKIMELLHERAIQPDRCVIVVTHDSRIYSYASRIAEMEDGRVISVHDDPKNFHHA